MTIDDFMKEIAPGMQKGWIAMDRENGRWYFFTQEPVSSNEFWSSAFGAAYYLMICSISVRSKTGLNH